MLVLMDARLGKKTACASEPSTKARKSQVGFLTSSLVGSTVSLRHCVYWLELELELADVDHPPPPQPAPVSLQPSSGKTSAAINKIPKIFFMALSMDVKQNN